MTHASESRCGPDCTKVRTSEASQSVVGRVATANVALMLVVFAYSFPHKKTYEGLMALLAHGIKPDLVVAAGFKVLPIKASPTRVGPQGLAFPTAEVVCRQFGVEYIESDHDAAELVARLELEQPSTGVILGARILKTPVIAPFRKGILNLHPGVLPHNRGLDNLKWAIINTLPQGVTSHLIDSAIDRGRLIKRRIIDVFADDTLLDINLRIQNTEIQLLTESVRAIEEGDPTRFPELGEGEYNTSMPPDVDARMLTIFPAYRSNYAALRARYVDAAHDSSQS